MWAGFRYSVDLRIQYAYNTKPVPLKYGKSPQNFCGYTDIVLQCVECPSRENRQKDGVHFVQHDVNLDNTGR